MHVAFGMGFDGGAWPGPLAGPGAVATFDEAWVGPAGLAKILETALGLGAPETLPGERAATLARTLTCTDGVWSSSAQVDPLAVARSLLGLRDALVDAGLRADAAPPALGERLGSILRVTRHARPGLPDRLAAVVESIFRAKADRVDLGLERLTLFEPRAQLSPLLRGVIDALDQSGVVVEERVVSAVPAAGTLGLSRGAFEPVGDGTLQLIRGDCPEETAIEIAAHLSLLPTLEQVVVIGADAILDAGLVRMGLPTLGARGARGDDGLLQVAPLVIALAWPERDPERALELLSLATSPIPRRVAAPLARSLIRVPAVGSQAWEDALADALAGLDDEAARERVRQRLALLVGGRAEEPSHGLPQAELVRRLDELRRWLFGRADREADERRYAGALAQVGAIARLARALGGETIGRVELLRIVEEATRSARPRAPREACAGLARVADPAAVVGGAAHVVWWRFLDESEPPLRPLPLTRAEQAALAAIGVALPSPGLVAERRALGWQRPLLCASESLVLGCPRRNATGADAHPHPLWDEIVARAGGARRAAVLESKTIAQTARVSRKEYRARAAPHSQSAWRFPSGAVPRPASESPSSRETLLGCSFRAVLERSGVRARQHRLPDGSRLFGEMAHDVLATVLRAAPGSPAHARSLAESAYDELVPRRAAAWLRPSMRSHRRRSRETIVAAAEELVRLLAERGLRVKLVEQEIEKGPPDRRMRGRPDLVVESPLVVIDLKSGGDIEKARALAECTAIQLVAYAHLVRDGDGAWPAIAYFQVQSRRLLTTDPWLGGGQAIASPHTVEDIFARLQRAGRAADAAIQSGTAVAPGVGVSIDALVSFVDGNEIHVAAPCRFCASATLCGRGLDGATRERPR